jgi:ABC-type amino acid transport substrate-binding protein
MMPPSALVVCLPAPTFVRTLATALVYLVFAGFAVAQDAPLKIAVGGLRLTEADLAGKQLAAVAHSSEAEYLDERHLRYAPFDDLPAALTALARGEADVVVNSIGALQYLISTRFKSTIRPPQAVLEPAYMAITLPPGSPLKKPIDEALVGITTSQEGARSRMATSARSNSHPRTRLD